MYLCVCFCVSFLTTKECKNEVLVNNLGHSWIFIVLEQSFVLISPVVLDKVVAAWLCLVYLKDSCILHQTETGDISCLDFQFYVFTVGGSFVRKTQFCHVWAQQKEKYAAFSDKRCSFSKIRCFWVWYFSSNVLPWEKFYIRSSFKYIFQTSPPVIVMLNAVGW